LLVNKGNTNNLLLNYKDNIYYKCIKKKNKYISIFKEIL